MRDVEVQDGSCENSEAEVYAEEATCDLSVHCPEWGPEDVVLAALDGQ